MEFIEVLNIIKKACAGTYCDDCDERIKNFCECVCYEKGSWLDLTTKKLENLTEGLVEWEQENHPKTKGEILKKFIHETFNIPFEDIEIFESCEKLRPKECDEFRDCSTCPYQNFWNKEHTPIE